MNQRVIEYCVAKGLCSAAPGKPSVNSANMLYVKDPKPDELTMSRVKFVETQMEARTDTSFNSFG